MFHCSFCGKNETEVKKLVAGPRVYICDECAVLVMNIMDSAGDNQPQPPRAEAAWWRSWLARVRRFLRGGQVPRVSSDFSG